MDHIPFNSHKYERDVIKRWMNISASWVIIGKAPATRWKPQSLISLQIKILS